jgi:transposase
MKAYSTDFRQKILETYETTPISQRQLAQKFSVALSFVQKLLKQRRLSGEISPLPHGGGRKLKLNPEQLQILSELNEQKNDATLEELQHQLYEKTGVHVSQSTVFRMVERLNLTLKKRRDPASA